MTDGTIAESLDGNRQAFTIVNPQRLHAFRPAMRQGPTARIERAHGGDAVRVIVPRRAGRHSSAGTRLRGSLILGF